jgi:hypothetical protein
VRPGNRGRFGHHLAAWLAAVHLPAKPAINYGVLREDLLDQAVWFILRGMGMTDKALRAYYNPKALALFFRADDAVEGRKVSRRSLKTT